MYTYNVISLNVKQCITSGRNTVAFLLLFKRDKATNALSLISLPSCLIASHLHSQGLPIEHFLLLLV